MRHENSGCLREGSEPWIPTYLTILPLVPHSWSGTNTGEETMGYSGVSLVDKLQFGNNNDERCR